MKEVRATFAAGEEISFAMIGNYFRVMSGGNDVLVTFPDINVSTNIPVGVGLNLELFKEVRVYSAVAQTLVFAVAKGRVDDSRVISKEMSGSSYSVPDVVPLSAGVAKEILELDVSRFKAAVQVGADSYIGSNNTLTALNGIKLAAGSLLTVNNTASLWCISASDTDVRILEEYI